MDCEHKQKYCCKIIVEIAIIDQSNGYHTCSSGDIILNNNNVEINGNGKTIYIHTSTHVMDHILPSINHHYVFYQM